MSVPALIALYVLKQKHREVKVPSLFLWKKTQSLMEASTPWERLRRNLLFILQLLLLLLLCFALCRPAVTGKGTFDEIIVIIDGSASMNAVDEGEKDTRFARAVKAASQTASGLRPGKKMSVIVAADTVVPAVSHSDNPGEILRALKSLECGYAGADVENALILADSMKTAGGNMLTVLYTDSAYETDDGQSLSAVDLSKGRKNRAVISVSCGAGEDGYTVLSTVCSYGEDCEETLEFYCDGQLRDARRVSLEAEKPLAVYWKCSDSGASVATVRFTGSDILSSDDEMSVPLTKSADKKIMLVSSSGFFFEKIFAAIGRCEVYKTDPASFDALDGERYDLYLFDSFVPEKIPASGAVWFWAPDRGTEGFEVGASLKGSCLSGADSAVSGEICRYMNLSEIQLARFCELTLGDGWQTAANCGMLPAAAVRSDPSGRKEAVIAFDLHDSNLPLLKEFPVFIQNLLSYSIPEMIEGSGVYEAGEVPQIRALAYAESVSVVSPDGKETVLAPPFPVSAYRLGLPGVYKVTQILAPRAGEEAGTPVTGFISAAIPEGESRMAGGGTLSPGSGSGDGDFRGQTELWPYILAAVLLLAVLEWGVYFREY